MKALILTLSMTMIFFFACNEDSISPEIPFEDENVTVSTDGKLADENARMTGFDEWGFNYNAHLYKGYLINAMIGDPAFEGTPHYRETPYQGEGVEFWNNFIKKYDYFIYWMPAGLLDCELTMRWNESLLSTTGVYPDTWMDTDAYINFKYTLKTDSENWTHIRKLVAIQSTDYLDGDRWYNQYGEEIGMKSYYWPDRLIIVQVINVGYNQYVPGAMPPDYTAPNGHGWGTYGN